MTAALRAKPEIVTALGRTEGYTGGIQRGGTSSACCLLGSLSDGVDKAGHQADSSVEAFGCCWMMGHSEAREAEMLRVALRLQSELVRLCHTVQCLQKSR
eukprot:366007-Chlamydomonas_euryale.AAC.9